MSELPDGMANGPSGNNHLGKDDQVWERPWTLEEMRRTSANWSLAADSGLFLFLQEFSQRIMSKTHEIERQLDRLIRDTKATDSCLHTVFNDFLMLSNTQFIENRVYDEEVEEPVAKTEAVVKQHEQEKTREQKEAELIPKMQEAVNYGLKVLDSAFEHLDIKAGNSDSEDEETTDRVEAILEPKDLYVDRPLPYLIGSRTFMEQDDVGLGDLSSDEMSIDSDRDSVIESDDGKQEVQSNDEFDQDEEGHGSIKKKSSLLSYEDDEEEEDDSDIFGESDKDDVDDEDETKSTGPPSSFVDELAARIKGDPISKPEADRASLTSSKKKSKGKKVPKPERSPAVDDDSDDMFKPPKMEDEDFSPFGGKSGLFSGGRGLFDDDEGDLFSDAPKPPVSEEKSTTHSAESVKTEKKIPAGAIPIFPGNGLFGSSSDSDSLQSKENGTPVKPKAQASLNSQQLPSGGGGGGLFDDDEDDFFTSHSVKKSSPAGRDKLKSQKAADLFGEDAEDYEAGDIFGETTSIPAQTDKDGAEVKAKPSQKKMPAGAISVFGPETKSLLTDGLRRHLPPTSQESEKPEENSPPADDGKAAATHMQKPLTRGLFSDDEDAQIFSTPPKSQSKPDNATLGKVGKSPVSLFDDEEEEDLFASVTKPKKKPNQAKAATPQPKKTASLFSDDEDQWLSSKPSPGKAESLTGGMKSSASAPSSLPSAKTLQKSSLFDDEDDDLFAPTKALSPNKPQRVALLFEEEADEHKGTVFGSKPIVGSGAPAVAAKMCVAPSVAPPAAPSLFKADQLRAGDKPPELGMPAVTSEEVRPETKKKPVGAVSLFGGIDVLANNAPSSDGTLPGGGGGELLSEDCAPPPAAEGEKKKEKMKANTVSLFNDDDDDWEEEDSDWSASSTIANKPAASTIKPTGEQQRTKSTGVFQDEELLFSHTQQKDNDPDVDLFTTSGKAVSTTSSSLKPTAPALFADDEEDDIFGSVKPKAPPPKVAEKPNKPGGEAALKPASSESTPDSENPAPSTVKPKQPSSRIGKLQSNLVINPTTLLPGSGYRIPGAVSVLPSLTTGSSSGVSSSSLSPSPITTPVGAHSGAEEGVSFDTPVQVNMLQSTNKGRAKGSVSRRPQSRAARQQAARRSVEDGEDGPPSPALPNSATVHTFSTPSPSQPSFAEVSPRPSDLSLPVSENLGKRDSSKKSRNSSVLLPSDEGDSDLFGSDSLFGGAEPVTKLTAPSSRQVAKMPLEQDDGAVSKKEKKAPPSIFDDHKDELFQKVKPRSTAKKAVPSPFLEEDDDDEGDIFGNSTSSTPSSNADKDTKPTSSPSTQDIFQDDVAPLPKAHKKHKEKPLDASLFDDNVDIFADLTVSSRPKEKAKKKVATKSIFDDDMDDIFSPSTVKAVTKAPHKSKKIQPSQDTSASADSGDIFDDPLNALGGN